VTGNADTPDARAIYALYTPGLISQAVRVALLLDLFTPLAGGPVDAEALARATSCIPEGVRVLLDCLVAFGLLRLAEGRYELTATAATFLVRGKPAYAGDWVLAETDPSFWEGVMGSIRSGEHVEGRFPWPQDAWLESYRSDRPEQALSLWRAAGIDPAGDSPLAVLDLASGCGIKSMALAQARPGVHVTCIDRADVLEVARDLASRLGVSARVSYEEGDVLEIGLGQGRYDGALLGQITDYFTPTQNVEFFEKLRKALKPSGVLLIEVPMSSDQPEKGPSLVSLLTWAISGGRAHSFGEYEAWLRQAGFRRIERPGPTWIIARPANSVRCRPDAT
jgi:SAM-dependent methyltransferase